MCSTHASSPHAPSLAQQDAPFFAVSLNAVIVTATPEEPRILVLCTEQGRLEALPAGPLTPDHRTLEAGLRAWVEQQTDQHLGYVEQLYTFGDRSRTGPDRAVAPQGLAIAYLALVREARPAGSMQAGWQNWHRYFPWEDWREGRPGILEPIRQKLLAWAALAPTDAARRLRRERTEPAWCTDQGSGRTGPNPGPDYAMRTEFGRPRSCMRLRTWAATSTSVARRSSVCARNRSPSTCFHLAMAPSARARFVCPDALCQALRPCSAICWRWRSRCVGACSAVWLGTAVARGGTTTAASE